MKKTLALVFVLLLVGQAFSSPSSQIWNPSTDILGKGTTQFQVVNFFSLFGPEDGGTEFPEDIGVLYGLFPGLEVGFDLLFPDSRPLSFNAKYGIPEKGLMPSFAIGGYGFGTMANVTNQNIIYAAAAKTFPVVGRLTVGYFSGNEQLLVNLNTGNKDNTGLILSWDKDLTNWLWANIDYAGTNSMLGAFFYGVSVAFASNAELVLGYGTFNSGAIAPVATTQLGINF